ncbi:MAG: hypothetical protein KGL67_01495 [Patescibacteria group bacterium]|nr:hypothetical protein [Patescibacteria group bacterium]
MKAKLKILATFFAKISVIIVLFSFVVAGQKSPAAIRTILIPVLTHNSLHTDEEELWSSVEVEYITLVDIQNGGFMHYRDPQGEFLAMGWDLGTTFDVPKNRGRFTLEGCFLMLYCKKHKMAYLLRQVQCLE